VLIELYIFAFISVAYGTFTTMAVVGFGKLNSPVKTLPGDPPFFSIVISARNEATNIQECVLQIIKQNFPKHLFELILVDDASEDETYQIAFELLDRSGLNHQIIKQSSHKGKKQNIAQAIQRSQGSIIITSDADVVYRNPNWLLTISDYFRKHASDMLIMPIDFETQEGFLTKFQIMENLALMATTAGYTGIQKPFMCNGANLAFKKSAYDNVLGYQSHIHISSGEDVFLLEDLKKINCRIDYALMRELIVKTKAHTSLKSLLQQRLRWANKAKYNPNALNLFAGFIIIAANMLFLALLVAILKKSVIIPYLSIFVLAKCVFDFLLLFLASNFLGRSKYMWWLIPFECIYWTYALTVGISSMFIKPLWKGKKIN
jgi:biofilm PGA synthesis N-glycosyltransferase PgaC